MIFLIIKNLALDIKKEDLQEITDYSANCCNLSISAETILIGYKLENAFHVFRILV